MRTVKLVALHKNLSKTHVGVSQTKPASLTKHKKETAFMHTIYLGAHYFVLSVQGDVSLG